MHKIIFLNLLLLFSIVSFAQVSLNKKDTLMGRAGEWKDAKTFLAKDGTAFTRSAKPSASTIMGFDIKLPASNGWAGRQKKAQQDEDAFKKDIETEITQSPELKYWGNELQAAIKTAQGYNDHLIVQPLSNQQPENMSAATAKNGNAALQIMSAWAASHCNEINQTASFLDKIKTTAGRNQYAENFAVAPQPPQYDVLEVCNDCHPQVRRDFNQQCTDYRQDYFDKYLQEPMDAILLCLKAQQAASLAGANGFSKKDIEADACLTTLQNSRILLTDFSQVNDIMDVMNKITYRKFFREYKDYEKMHVPLLMVILSMEQQQQVLSGKGSEYFEEEMQAANKQLDKILDEWEKRLKSGDIRMLASYAGVLEILSQKSILGFDEGQQASDRITNLLAKNLIVKINVDADTKITGETEDMNYEIAHVKGEGFMGVQVDSIKCMWMEPVQDNHGAFVSLVKGGINMKVVAGEMFAKGTNGQPDTKANYRSPSDYEITPRIHFDICKDGDQKHYFIFDYLGPEPGKYMETWSGIDRPVIGGLNAPFMLSFKSEDYTVNESETRNEAENVRDSLNANKDKDMAELKKAAADMQAKRITYQQFMAIQKKITDKVLGNVEKLKEAAVYVKIPISLSPEKGFFINQRIDAKSLNPGKKEIVYGYLTLQLKPNK